MSWSSYTDVRWCTKIAAQHLLVVPSDAAAAAAKQAKAAVGSE